MTHGLEVVNNTKASIKCTICPFKNLTFGWKREDGKDLPINRTKIFDCTLEISPVLMEDAGNYTCIASSRDSYSSQILKDHVSLTVLGITCLLAIIFTQICSREGSDHRFCYR